MFENVARHAERKRNKQVEEIRSRLIALHLEERALTTQLIAICGTEQTAEVLISAHETARISAPRHLDTEQR